MGTTRLPVALAAVALVASACGQKGDDGSPGATTHSSDDGGTRDSGSGAHPPAIDGSASPSRDAGQPPATGGTTAAYEAEDAFNGGTATFATSVTGFSGTGYVDAFGAAQSNLVFAVNAASDGTTNITLHYRSDGAPKVLAVYVNGTKAFDVTLAATSSAGFSPHVDALAMRTGLNTIAYRDEDGSPNTVSVDSLEIANGASRKVRGATMPFTEYEAEAGKTTGVAIGPDRTYGTVAAEASGRKAVRLDTIGQYVEWTTSAPANALVVRYSMPDAQAGGGTTGTLSLYVNGSKKQSLAVSSKYAWVYGGYPFNDDPSQGSPHRYFDDSRFLIGDVPMGATVRLQRDAGDAQVTVDLIDMEVAPPAYAQPAGSLSIADFGATDGDGSDDAPAIVNAIAAATSQKKVLFIPAGTFDLKSRVDVDHVTIRGAGPWSSILRGANGKGGFNGTGDGVQLLDFAILGDVRYRDDQNFDAGLDGQIGRGSLVQNVWFEHTKVGIWLHAPTQGAYLVGCRIHDTFADGINLNGGTRDTAAEHVHIRNTGDDAFAIFANASGTNGNRFKLDSASAPTLANGFAIYGGSDNGIEDSDAADTVTASAGIAVSTRFAPTPLGGTTRVLRSTVTRTGGHEPNWNSNFGGLWIYADTSDISSPVVVRDVTISDSTYQGILVSFDKSITNLVFDGVTIAGAGTYGIEIAATGGATFDGVTVSGATSGGATIASGFTVTKGAGNSGW